MLLNQSNMSAPDIEDSDIEVAMQEEIPIKQNTGSRPPVPNPYSNQDRMGNSMNATGSKWVNHLKKDQNDTAIRPQSRGNDSSSGVRAMERSARDLPQEYESNPVWQNRIKKMQTIANDKTPVKQSTKTPAQEEPTP